MSNKQAQAQPKQPFNDKDFDKIPVKFTDMEVQYVANQLIRKDRIIAAVNHQFGESLQHFAVMCAKRKNIQFPDNKFAGVMFDTKKERAFIMIYKKDPPKPEKPANKG